jgi:gliding motility-associated-like protein
VKIRYCIKTLFFFLYTCFIINVQQAQTVCSPDKFRAGNTSIVGAKSGFLATLPNGEYIYNSQTFNDQCIIKTDVKGDLIWAKKYSVNTLLGSGGLHGALDKNGNIISSLYTDVLIITNQNGDILTSKKLRIPSQNVIIKRIAIAPDNDKIVLVEDESTYANEGYMLIRFSPDLSSIKWLKHFNGKDLFLHEIEIRDNRILICGSKHPNGIMMIFDLTTGTILHQRELWLDNGGNSYNVSQFKKYNDGYVAIVENFNPSNINKAILRYDQNFNQINSYYIHPFVIDQKFRLLVDSSGSFTACATGHSQFFAFLQVTSTDSIVLSKSGQTAWWSVPTDFTYTNGGYALLSYDNYTAVGVGNFGFTMLTSFDANGDVDKNSYCSASDVVIQKTTCNNGYSFPAIQARDTTLLSLQNVAVTVNSQTFYASDKSCYKKNECNELKIEGAANLCGVSSTILNAKRNDLCSSPVSWTVPGSGLRKDVLNDSSCLLTFTQSGSYKVIATIISLCDTIRDTIDVNVTLSGLTLSLGTDFSLCPSNMQLLNARKGFTSYRWQDGSSDSTFLVTQPGMYHITVTDACNNIFKDTVIVTAAPPVPLSIGPDKTKCNNDTLHISAPAGFINYAWSPNYNINNTNSQNVIISPAVDTTYYIKAEKTPGCFGFDTIRIKVNTSPPINLGNDASFCNGDSIVLNAGTGFSTYQWSNGISSQINAVKAAGTYSVKATTLQGCTSYDTLKVLNVFSNPVIRLSKDTGLCIGTSRLLDPGSYSSYLWNTGSTSRTISVNNTGIYTVTVTDNNGCKGKDSSRITVLYPNPSSFLPLDTSICSYGKLDLSPLSNYQTYLWSNNSITKTISISLPGIYWLTVKDANQCTGTDSIKVLLKECLKGFYMPNAFTPDGNNLNDELKPFLFGNVKTYTFTIYNRWGQVVFQTSDRFRGWDGTFKGIAQDPASYTWKCSYQLEGEQPVIKKGTAILIR